MIVADQFNHRVIRLYPGETEGVVIAGGLGPGSDLNQLDHPRGVTIHPGTHDLYIADSENHRVLRWKWNAQVGELFCGGNGRGSGLHQLNEPKGLLLDPEGHLYIADVKNHRILRWKAGAQQAEVVAGNFGPGKKLNQLNWPHGIALDPDGDLFVSDHLNHRVVCWKKGATQGEVVAGKGGRGINPDQLDAPCGISFDLHGKLLIADAGNHRVMKYSTDSKGAWVQDGECVAGGNLSGDKLNQLSWPNMVSAMPSGGILIADSANHRVMRVEPGDNRKGVIVAGGNGPGAGLDQLNGPVT
jgi:DNA-binding beta-propeller fold protein YncE